MCVVAGIKYANLLSNEDEVRVLPDADQQAFEFSRGSVLLDCA